MSFFWKADLACPRCGEDAISAWRKLWIGPALSTKCRECGRRISVSWYTMLAVIPFSMLIVWSDSVDSLALKVPVWTAVLLAIHFWVMRCISLVRR